MPKKSKKKKELLITLAVGRSRLHEVLENEMDRFRDSEREFFKSNWASMNVEGDAGRGEVGSVLTPSESGSQNGFPIPGHNQHVYDFFTG